MPDLLLELFSEEIPARMQAKAADDLRRMVTDKLVAEGLVYEGAKAFATPRRLALTVHGIPVRQSDLKEERRGPRVGGPDAAIQGFLKATGLSSIRISPSSGCMSPYRTFIRVVLPAPFSPSRACTWPGDTERSIRSLATSEPNRLVMPFSSSSTSTLRSP